MNEINEDEYYEWQQRQEDAENYNSFDEMFRDAVKAGVTIPPINSPSARDTLSKHWDQLSGYSDNMVVQLYRVHFYEWLEKQGGDPDNGTNIRALKSFFKYLEGRKEYTKSISEIRADKWKGNEDSSNKNEGFKYMDFGSLFKDMLKAGAVPPLRVIWDIYKTTGPWKPAQYNFIKEPYSQAFSVWTSEQVGEEPPPEAYYTIERWLTFAESLLRQCEDLLKRDIVIGNIDVPKLFYPVTDKINRMKREYNFQVTTRGQADEKPMTNGKKSTTGTTNPAIRRLCEIVNDAGLYPKHSDESNEKYCKRICEKYSLAYADNVRQNFKTGQRITANDRYLMTVINHILPNIPEKDQEAIKTYIKGQAPGLNVG